MTFTMYFFNIIYFIEKGTKLHTYKLIGRDDVLGHLANIPSRFPRSGIEPPTTPFMLDTFPLLIIIIIISSTQVIETFVISLRT